MKCFGAEPRKDQRPGPRRDAQLPAEEPTAAQPLSAQPGGVSLGPQTTTGKLSSQQNQRARLSRAWCLRFLHEHSVYTKSTAQMTKSQNCFPQLNILHRAVCAPIHAPHQNLLAHEHCGCGC